MEVDSWSPDLLTGGTRGVISGGFNPGGTNIIDYINISSTGDAIDFGDQTAVFRSSGQCSSSTRGLIAGGVTIPGGTKQKRY